MQPLPTYSTCYQLNKSKSKINKIVSSVGLFHPSFLPQPVYGVDVYFAGAKFVFERVDATKWAEEGVVWFEMKGNRVLETSSGKKNPKKWLPTHLIAFTESANESNITQAITTRRAIGIQMQFHSLWAYGFPFALAAHTQCTFGFSMYRWVWIREAKSVQRWKELNTRETLKLTRINQSIIISRKFNSMERAGTYVVRHSDSHQTKWENKNSPQTVI